MPAMLFASKYFFEKVRMIPIGTLSNMSSALAVLPLRIAFCSMMAESKCDPSFGPLTNVSTTRSRSEIQQRVGETPTYHPMALAVENLEVIRHLVEDLGYPVNHIIPPMNCSSPLQAAAACPSPAALATVEYLLSKGAEVDIRCECCKTNVTPLMAAIEPRIVDSVKLLLRRGADPNAKLEGSLTVLGLACCFEDSDITIAKLLIDHGADVSGMDNTNEFSILGAAVLSGNAAGTRMLLAHGANSNVPSVLQTFISRDEWPNHLVASLKCMRKSDDVVASLLLGRNVSPRSTKATSKE